jgi:pimeloyl-ACP methyl ester carboxylesterase
VTRFRWRYAMPLLSAAERRVIALDPRGMGDSNRPRPVVCRA